MTQHDYKAALDTIDIHCFTAGLWVVKHKQAILHALRIADKLMEEPSEGMNLAGVDAWEKSPLAVVAQFKAMRDQMLKEIDLE